MGFKYNRYVGEYFSCRKARQFQRHALRRRKGKNFIAVRRKRKLRRMRGIVDNIPFPYRRDNRIARSKNESEYEE